MDLPIGVPAVTAVAFSPDGKRLAIGDSSGIVNVLELTSGARVLACQGRVGRRFQP